MKTHLLFACAAVALIFAGAITVRAADEKGPALAAAVKQAIETKDAAALDKLVYWEGASEGGKKFFQALLESALEIKVQNVEVTPLPPGKTGPPTTMSVTHLLRITGKEGEGPSRQMFPVGEKDGKLYLAAAKDSPPGMSQD